MKIIYVIICVFLYTSLGYSQTSNTPATEAVAGLLANMVNFDSTNAQLKASFAPSFAKANSIASETKGVDVYRPEHFMIQGVQGNIVTSLIWVEGFSWVHKLRFKTVKEDGRTHVMPSGMRGNIIVPWHSLETFIEIDTSTLVSNTDFQPVDSVEPLGIEDVAKNERTEVVKQMLSGMVHAEEISNAQLKTLLAPSFARANSIGEKGVGIEVFPPDYFMISEVDGNMVTGLIWNERKSWVHQLKFNTVQENGRTYIMPSGIDAYNMIQPWHTVEKFMPIQRSKLVANEDVINLNVLIEQNDEEGEEEAQEEPKEENARKKLSSYIAFNGEMVGDNPAENTIALIISKSEMVTLVVSQGTLAFNIYETKQLNTGKVHQIVFRIEKNTLTPGNFDWKEFVITDVSQLTNEEKRPYIAGLISDCKYVIDIKGDPKLRFMSNLITGNIE